MSRTVQLLIYALLAIGLSACGATESRAPAAACAELSPEIASAQAMVQIPAGEIIVGAEDAEPEERPQRRVFVDAFAIDITEVTNAQYAKFVAATGYLTVAERGRAGSAVFDPSLGNDGWWRLDPEATWKTPTGRGSSIEGKENYPVVHVVLDDALAYARWLGRDLPTEAEWERAARGAHVGARYAWGESARPNGRIMSNHWQGVFPVVNTGEDGFKDAAPVGCFPANDFGAYDMIGNVWEITKDAWPSPGAVDAAVIKGGSYLCSDSFCQRYRPAARQPGDRTLGASHIGFRTVQRKRG